MSAEPPEIARIDAKIIHIDMDAFYASVEQRDNPELRGLPVAVGGGGPRGVVTTASYEARPFGVRSAMPGFKARRLCPDLIFVKPRFDAYKAVSRQIREIFQRYTDLIEPLSLDEAFLDVTRPKAGGGSATEIAAAIKTAIKEATGLTASAGVSFNKFLAKIASDLDKPDGLSVIRPEQADGFIAGLAVRAFLRRRPGDRGQDEGCRHPHRPRPQTTLGGGACPALRQDRATLLPDRARHRRARGQA